MKETIYSKHDKLLLWKLCLIIALAITTFLNSCYFINESLPDHNMISNLVMAAAPLHNLGFPYKDYWDIYPPGIYLFLTPFVYFFNASTMSLKIFHIIFSLIIGLITLKLLFNIFKKFEYKIISITIFFALYLCMSGYYSCILFHNAFLALFISMTGLYFIYFSKNNILKYFLSSFLFSFAGNMKETFLFLIFLPFIYITAKYLLRKNKYYKLFCKTFIYSITGIILAYFIDYIYLLILGVTKYYSQVEAYKSTLLFTSAKSFLTTFLVNLNPFNLFHFTVTFYEVLRRFFFQPFIFSYIVFFVIFLFTAMYSKVYINTQSKTKLRFKFNKTWSPLQKEIILIFGFLILNFNGYRIVSEYGPNYILQLAPSILLSFALLFKLTHDSFFTFLIKIHNPKNKIQINNSLRFLYQKKKYIISAVIFFLFLNFLIPYNGLFDYFNKTTTSNYIRGLKKGKPLIKIPLQVKNVMKDDNRVFCVYGWGMPDFYYLSNTMPFSRYFILNVTGPPQWKELASHFKKELPKVILYTTEGADMDINNFEKNAINIKKILNKCYIFYPYKIKGGNSFKGYYLLKNEEYFKTHEVEFIP